VASATEQQYMHLMARASLVVVPVQWKPQHMGGEQTYANAMTMGKPTIVTDLAADDYIQSQVTGLLTPSGDAAALRAAIIQIMEDRDLARAMGAKAKEAAAQLRPERFFADVLRACAP